MKARTIANQVVVTAILVLATVTSVEARDQVVDSEAIAVLDTFMAAFNARDVRAFEETLHFPHYRIASGRVTVLEKAGTRPDLFERFVAATPGWDHSAWDRRQVIHYSADKVHFDTRFIRYRSDGSVLASFDSLYIVTKQDGRWGIKARSSFAP